jgi:hypothetical protein
MLVALKFAVGALSAMFMTIIALSHCVTVFISPDFGILGFPFVQSISQEILIVLK